MSAAADAPGDALRVEGLEVAYRVRGRYRPVLRGVSLRIGAGESYGLVGESGCGKSTTALAAVRYLPRNGAVRAGRIEIAGRDVLSQAPAELRRMRSSVVSMVYQDPAKALNPSLRIGRQVAEVSECAGKSGEEARVHAHEMLTRVRIVDPDRVMERYPHQLSGGMQQRVVIAMALASNPSLLILDEPTTGLDATVEAEVLDLIVQLRSEISTSVLFISHNLGLIARMCDRTGVLYAGTLIEEGPTQAVFDDPRHPYTVGLLRCIPRRGRRKDHGRLDTIPGFLPAPGARIEGCVFAPRCAIADERCTAEAPAEQRFGDRMSRCHYHERAPGLPRVSPGDAPEPAVTDETVLLDIARLSKTYRAGTYAARALADLTIQVRAGETLGLVGESGSGKTTFAKVLLGITAPDPGGRIRLDEVELGPDLSARGRDQVKSVQIVFQNPDSALNRAHRISRIVGRALTRLAGLRGTERRRRLEALIDSVQLARRYLWMRPRQLSGGLKQRVAIARAFAGNPRLVVCDEPTSALDVSVQAAILNLLADLQRERRVAYVFISHDLGVVRYLSDRIAVLYLGRLLEIGPAEQVFSGPHHPYTEALLSAVPSIDGVVRQRIRLHGEIPSAINPPSGCVFHTRCPRKLGEICEREEPALHGLESGHAIRCHIPVEELSELQGQAG